MRASPNPKSAVVCPVLLATECRYCKKLGHTKSACPVLLEQSKPTKKIQSVPPQPVVKTPAPAKIANRFAALADLSDEEEEEEQFPSLPTVQKSTTCRVAMSIYPTVQSDISYSHIAAKSSLKVTVSAQTLPRHCESVKRVEFSDWDTIQPVYISQPVSVCGRETDVNDDKLDSSAFIPLQIKQIKTRAWDDDESDDEPEAVTCAGVEDDDEDW